MIDVAVVGGGPAGAWTAYRLARSGARVAIVDPSHPREKPCGGGVTGRALTLVAGAIDRESLPAVTIRTARFVDSTRRHAVSVPLGDTPADLIVLSRRAFDGALYDAAVGAGAVPVKARARDIERRGSGLVVATDAAPIAAKIVVGADGANSLVRRRLSTAFRRDQLSVATGYYAHGATADVVDIEFVADPPGYLWSFPRPDHLAIGICAEADAGIGPDSLREAAARWMRAIDVPSTAALTPYSWPIPSLSGGDLDSLEAAGPNWALVGDAAGLVDPITREGIYFALASADRLAAALTSSHPSPLAAYETDVRDEIGRDLAKAARFKRQFFRPSFVSLLIDALERSEGVRRVLVDLVAGRVQYRTLAWRLVQTLEIRLACTWLKRES